MLFCATVLTVICASTTYLPKSGIESGPMLLDFFAFQLEWYSGKKNLTEDGSSVNI